MKRPLAAIGLIYLAASAAAVCLSPKVNFILCVMAAIIAIAACFIRCEKTRSVLIVLCPVFTALLVIACCQLRANRLWDSLSEKSCVISGEICEMPRRQYGRWRYIIETDSVDLPDVKQNMRILMTSQNAFEEAKEGDRITCEVQFLQSNNETGYNSTTSLRADGVNARCWHKPYSAYKVSYGGSQLRYWPYSIRRAVTSVIRRALPKHASAMLCGMLLGDTDYMNASTVESFRSTGIAHLLAVSGLHLTLLTLALSELLRRMKINPRPSSVITILFILLFMSVTGFPPSVVRAGVMHIMAQLGKITFRDVDSLTSMSIAVLLMCAVNPWAAADIGLQLSVCSTLGLLLAAGRVNRFLLQSSRKLLTRLKIMPKSNALKKAGKYALRSVSVSVTASLSILPLTATHFESISIISPLTNLLCVYIASVFIILGAIASLIYCIPFVGWILSFPLRFAAAALCAYLEAVAGCLGRLPFASLNTSSAYTPYIICIITLLPVGAFVLNRRFKNASFSKALRGGVACVLAVLLLSSLVWRSVRCSGAEIIIFDVNSGGMCVCAKNRTHAVLAEAGGDSYGMSVISRTLRDKGVTKVDAIAVSNSTKARSGNFYRMMDQFAPDYMLTDIDLYFDQHTLIQPFKSTVDTGVSGLSLETFTDSSKGRWERLICGETTALVCPEKGDCSLLPEKWRKCDAAIVGKSINGITVLKAGAIIITAGKKNADALYSQLRDMHIERIYRTSSDGCITVSVKKNQLTVTTGN